MRWLFFLIPLLLYSQPSPGDEDLTLFHHVNVLSGHLNLAFQDALVKGADPIPLSRTYTSAGAFECSDKNFDLCLKEIRGDFLIQGGWSLFAHANLLIEQNFDQESPKLYLAEPNGSFISYHFVKKIKNHTYLYEPSSKGGSASGVLSARFNPSNNALHWEVKKGKATLYLPDGGIRFYKGKGLKKRTWVDALYSSTPPLQSYLLLTKEILPNQHRLLYHYDQNKRLIRIDTTNPEENHVFSSINFNHLHTGAPFKLEVTTSDGHLIAYEAEKKEKQPPSKKAQKRDYLQKIDRENLSQSIYYAPGRRGIGALLNGVYSNNKPEFTVDYYAPTNKEEERIWEKRPAEKPFYADKVASINVPLGPNNSLIPLAQFQYSPNLTEVRDIDNLLIRYHHEDSRLKEIEYFDENDQFTSSIQFFWKDNFLQTKVHLDSKKNPLFAKSFSCDEKGNVLEEIFWGTLTNNPAPPLRIDSEGNLSGGETYFKRYTYCPHFNVVLSEEEEGGLTYRYTYKPNTNLLTSRLTCEGKEILLRNFYLYNRDNLLIGEIVDDGSGPLEQDLRGVSERHIKSYTLDPKSGLITGIRESYLENGIDTLFHRIELLYNDRLEVVEERFFDGTDTYRYTIYKDYDSQGRLIRETNPLGQPSTYQYDSSNNIIEAKQVGSSAQLHSYDYTNRLTYSAGKNDSRSKSTSYDRKGRPLSQRDHFHNPTKQLYDAFGRCVETELPLLKDDNDSVYSPKITFAYDALGNLISSTTPQGNTTLTSYNSLRKPLHIRHPDGTETHHFYTKTGLLEKTIHPDETSTFYTYDIFQRPLTVTLYSSSNELLSSESSTYNAFHLLSSTDPNQLTTCYSYDGAGRKIAERVKERLTTFSYDSLNFLTKTSQGEMTHVQLHNLLGLITDQWDEHISGWKENEMSFIYDEENRKQIVTRVTSQGVAQDYLSYDAHNQLTSHTDPLGNKTVIVYKENYRNELNQRVLKKTITNPLGHSTVEIYDSGGRLVSRTKRDAEQKAVAQETFSYDRGGNKARHTTTTYIDNTPSSDFTICWEYDALGRVTRQIEADKKITLYAYDKAGRLTERTLPSGITLFHTYDELGRPLTLKSSDDTIDYEYLYTDCSSYPTTLIDHLNRLRLSRTYNSFGQLTHEDTSWGLHFCSEYDSLGRRQALHLPDHSHIQYTYSGNHLTSVKRYDSSNRFLYQHQYLAFDPNGHVQNESLILNLGTLETTHDLLERPTSQSSSYLTHGISYGPSGLVTSTSNTLLSSKNYTYDPLDQIRQENDTSYHFDSLGNPTNCSINSLNQILSTSSETFVYDPDGNPLQRSSTTYTYDALGRLTSISYPHKKITYLYDPLSRLISKTTTESPSKQFYLYDDEEEIGTITPSLEIQELKVLGLGICGSVGGAIAIELQSIPYAPLHDFRGNIIGLASPTLFISCEIDAFGNHDPFPSPWCFSSKRSEETLIFFGNRFYDPSLCRWLTPDPAGFVDSPNLYLYVLNSPLNRLDLFGLLSQSPFQIQAEQSVLSSFQSNPQTQGLYPCKGFLNGTPVDWVVSCNHWDRLQYTPEELETGKVNIADHFSDLMPKEGRTIGIITAQNGINTTKKEFYEMCRSIVSKLPEGTFFLGLYNPCGPAFFDGPRALDEMFDLNKHPNEEWTKQFMVHIGREVAKINPTQGWLHLPHSEAGCLTVHAIRDMTNDDQKIMQKQLSVTGLAPALPISKNHAYQARNIYSEQDIVTGRFCKKMGFLNDPSYDILFLKPLAAGKQNFLYKLNEHSFMGPTLQKGLQDSLDELRSERGFYNAQTR